MSARRALAKRLNLPATCRLAVAITSSTDDLPKQAFDNCRPTAGLGTD
jgi:hypothetical protein